MEVVFNDESLDRLETDSGFDARLPPAVVVAYRKRIQMIRAAGDERVFFALRSLRFEKLKGKRRGQYSMRLNDQWRLILKLKPVRDGKRVELVGIEDYH